MTYVDPVVPGELYNACIVCTGPEYRGQMTYISGLFGYPDTWKHVACTPADKALFGKP